MRRLAAFALAALAALAACDSEPELNNAQLSDVIENVSELQEPEDEEPPPPALIEVRREDLQGQLGPGAVCDFSQGGRLLFVSAASGSAFAKVNGLPVRLAASGPIGSTGGFWVTERFSISIGRLADSRVEAEKATSWPARLVLIDRRAEENKELRLEGAWRCGG